MVYVKLLGDDSRPSQVICKARVAPMKSYSIPRLELLGALLAARLVSQVKAAFSKLNVKKVVCFTDSMNVLHWIRHAEKDWKPFVMHRVLEILKLTEPLDWFYISTDCNPADLPSRGTSADFLQSDLWLHGPSMLVNFILEKDQVLDFNTIHNLELKGNTHVLLENPQEPLQQLLTLHDFSTLNGLLNRTFLILRFINNIKVRLDWPFLSEHELYKCAFYYWISYVQANHFHKELCYLKSSAAHPVPNLVKTLNLFLDDNNFIRCKGRIHYSELPHDAKYPILLPKKDHFVVLLIRDAHEKVLHAGVRDTLHHLRMKFWILHGRQTVRSVIHRCIACRRVEGPSYSVPNSPPLPDFRSTFSRCFDATGVDFAGPMLVKTNEGVSKAYFAIFTCAAVRAVHLELVPNLSVLSFLNAFKRFKNRRGIPSIIISDNARTFKRAAEEVSRFLDSQDLRTFLNKLSIQWHFIVEKSPWWGGILREACQDS